VPNAPDDLTTHNCVRYRHTSSGGIYRWEFADPERPRRDIDIEPQGSFTTNDDEMMVRAALRGMGRIMHVGPAVRAYIAGGSLIRVLARLRLPSLHAVARLQAGEDAGLHRLLHREARASRPRMRGSHSPGTRLRAAAARPIEQAAGPSPRPGSISVAAGRIAKHCAQWALVT
jgi:DNA-binding transcriptional LysR family regulator